MTQFDNSFSDDFYYNALLDVDQSGLEHIYLEFRQPIIRAVTLAGGTSADAGVFFMTALHEMTALFRKQEIQNSMPPDEDIEEEKDYMLDEKPPFFQQIKSLALAHYKDWLLERGQRGAADVAEKNETHDDSITDKYQYSYTSDYEAGIKSPPIEEILAEDTTPQAEEEAPTLVVPDSEKMRLTRSKIFAWKKLDFLPPKTKDKLLSAVQDNRSAENAEINAYRASLLLNQDTGVDLPDWAMEALTDKQGYALWKKSQTIERRIGAGLPIVEAPRRIHRTEYIARLIFLTMLLGCLAWIFWPRGSKAAKQAYKDVFAPPESMMADLEKRYGPDLAFDSITARPPLCTETLKQADEDYQNKNYPDALSRMGDMYENGDPLCQSDALFYMGIIFLQLEEPGKTIACFAKIEDLERYGEDLYWYQALAFVKKAELDPDKIKIARKAVKQAIANTQNPERREQAEKMLLKLGTTVE